MTRPAALSADWVLPVLLRNAMALAVVAGGLHLWFHTFRGQAATASSTRPIPEGGAGRASSWAIRPGTTFSER